MHVACYCYTVWIPVLSLIAYRLVFVYNHWYLLTVVCHIFCSMLFNQIWSVFDLTPVFYCSILLSIQFWHTNIRICSHKCSTHVRGIYKDYCIQYFYISLKLKKWSDFYWDITFDKEVKTAYVNTKMSYLKGVRS
jgi:hypothetical protein